MTRIRFVLRRRDVRVRVGQYTASPSGVVGRVRHYTA